MPTVSSICEKLGLVKRSKDDAGFAKSIIDNFALRLPQPYIEFIENFSGEMTSPLGFWDPSKTKCELRKENQTTAEALRSHLKFLGADVRKQARATQDAELFDHMVCTIEIEEFIPLNADNDQLSLTWLLNKCQLNQNVFANSLIPIATTNSSLNISVSCFPDTFGRLYYGFSGFAHLLHEHSNDASPTQFLNEVDGDVIVLAESFSDFLELVIPSTILLFDDYQIDQSSLELLGYSSYRVTHDKPEEE